MKKVLLTGASGFVGGHLIDYLLSQGDYDIYGTYRSEKPEGESDHLHFLKADFENRSEVDSLFSELQPDWIIHLAAQANVPQSFKDPTQTFHSNIDSQLNMFESLRAKDLLQTKLLVISSAEIYGLVTPSDVPVDEETPFRPANPYAVSKIAQDYLGYQYFVSYNMPVIRVRPFTHIGPRQAPTFVASDFAKQIAEIEKGSKEPVMQVGNLDARRDFTDVRDMVKLYPLLLEKGEVGEAYNAGSGTSHSIQEVLDTLLSFSDKKITVEHDPAKMRPSDVPELKADPSKVEKITGWKPEIPFEQTLKDTLEYWRKVV